MIYFAVMLNGVTFVRALKYMATSALKRITKQIFNCPLGIVPSGTKKLRISLFSVVISLTSQIPGTLVCCLLNNLYFLLSLF